MSLSTKPLSPPAMVSQFLEEDYASIDAEMPELLKELDKLSAAEDWHKHGTFKEHLLGVYRILKLWGQSRDACLCGLLHSVYSNEYVDLALFDVNDGRRELQNLVGESAEELIFLFCTMPRTQYTIEILQRDTIPEDGLLLTKSNGDDLRLTKEQVGIFLAVTVADLAEQWFSWQDEIMSGYPFEMQKVPVASHWSAGLWPGPVRPSESTPSLLSRLASRLPQFNIPLPPIFENCTAVLTPEDNAASVALYWQVISQDMRTSASPDSAIYILEQSLSHNPWFAEVHLMLSQLYLVKAEFEIAQKHAEQGLQLLCDWGTSWDKRVAWSGWVAWARILVQRAAAKEWPEHLQKLNNLGLVVTPPETASEEEPALAAG